MSTQNKHNGVTSYTIDEADNISLGQGGYDILKGKADADGIEHIAGRGVSAGDVVYYPGVNYWVSIKAITQGNAPDDSSVIAETLVGDDLMVRPVTGYSSTGSNYNLDLQADDVINGCFTKIRICDAVTYIQALRG
tara:strand:+ start:291 stop:698 length:408 start_codon:yes stop_codon:yes gene_type:complete